MTKLFYRYRLVDRAAWRRARHALLRAVPDASVLFEAALRGDDTARLALADRAEEAGHEYAARFLRNNLTCLKPAWVVKQRRTRRRRGQ